MWHMLYGAYGVQDVQSCLTRALRTATSHIIIFTSFPSQNKYIHSVCEDRYNGLGKDFTWHQVKGGKDDDDEGLQDIIEC